jgi:MFS family permease
LADKFGRRKMTLVFATLYALCCIIKFSSNFWILMIGRLMGGISTSLLYSVFESWYVKQHLEVEKLPSGTGFLFNNNNFIHSGVVTLKGLCLFMLKAFGVHKPYQNLKSFF